jgi:hypothetical protein
VQALLRPRVMLGVRDPAPSALKHGGLTLTV